MTTTFDLVEYYTNLLIVQYNQLPKAAARTFTDVTPVIMPQQGQESLLFSPAPTSGTFVLSYAGVNTAAINWDDTAAQVQTKLRAIPALESVVVTGSIATSLTVDFFGVFGFPELLVVFSNAVV